jgi:fatty acid desaturase
VSSRTPSRQIKWIKPDIDKRLLKELHERSDLKGGLQAGGFLLLISATGTAAVLSSLYQPWWITGILLFLHGTCCAFLINGIHELIHGTVFRTKWLNTAFTVIFSFLYVFNPVFFWASHTKHHRYTLHQPDDLEVVLPMRLTLGGFLEFAFVNPRALVNGLWIQVRYLFGIMKTDWEKTLFPPEAKKERRRLARWSAAILGGHAAILAIAIATGLWILPVVISGCGYYGGWLLYLLNNTQHVGLTDEVPDYRLCCRTILVNPVFQFLYWHMNFHTEHHMWAAVPCYNLPRLHRAIRHQLPDPPRGLIQTWSQIIQILKRQKQDPTYQFRPRIPGESS